MSRAATQAEFPAQFQLIAAMNPCPCGHLGSRVKACRCTPDQVAAQIKQEYERVGGFDHLLMMMQAGFLDHKSTVRNMTLFAKEVYPQIRDLPGTRQIMAAAAE